MEVTCTIYCEEDMPRIIDEFGTKAMVPVMQQVKKFHGTDNEQVMTQVAEFFAGVIDFSGSKRFYLGIAISVPISLKSQKIDSH